jgi:hypothetical protein
MQGKVLGDIHSRIPMVTLDEQQALKLANAEADERFWTGLRAMHEEQVEGHKGLVAVAERTIARGQAGAAEAAAKAGEVKDRVERLKRGEDVPGGLGKPLTHEDLKRIFREAGWTNEDIRNAARWSEVCDALGFETAVNFIKAERDRAERPAVRALHRLFEDNEQS